VYLVRFSILVFAAPTAWADSSVITPTEKSPIVEKAERSSDPLAADLLNQSSAEQYGDLLWLR